MLREANLPTTAITLPCHLARYNLGDITAGVLRMS